MMNARNPKLLTVAAALAAVSAGSQAAIASPESAPPASDGHGGRDHVPDAKVNQPNAFVTVGKDRLGFIVDHSPNGEVIKAAHYSHSSHSSHASHSSHYSSSY